MFFIVSAALFVLLACLLIVLLYIYISLVGMHISSSKDAPYVASSSKVIQNIIERVKIDNKTTMLELGCGDARILRGVVSRTGATGIGVDSSAPFAFLAWVLSFTDWTFSKIKYYHKNILDIDFSRANVIYFFWTRDFINSEKFKNKLTGETKPGSVIVSHWFEVPYLVNCEFARDMDGKHSTYFYRI